jgi:hypothetical protein
MKEDNFQLLLKKRKYPYEYVDSSETQPSPKEAYHSELSGEDITDENYALTHHVWTTFDCKTFGDYHNLHNKADVLQIADIFESFRDVCMKNYKLDPLWCCTTPGMAWDACLKLTGTSLALPKEIDMILLIKAGT